MITGTIPVRRSGRPPKYGESVRTLVLTLAADPEETIAGIHKKTGIPRTTCSRWIADAIEANRKAPVPTTDPGH